jgi:flagellar biogenesis protein FliO
MGIISPFGHMAPVCALASPVADGDGTFSLISYLLVIAIFIFLAAVVTRMIGNKLTGKRRGKLIKCVDSTSLGLDKRVFIVQVEKTSYIIYSDKTNAVLLDKREDIAEPVPELKSEFGSDTIFESVRSFRDVLENIKKKKG